MPVRQVDWSTGLEADPANTDSAGQADDNMRETRLAVRERGNVEHDWSDSSVDASYGDTGRHTPGSARAFLATSAPTTLWQPDGTANTDLDNSGALDDGRLLALVTADPSSPTYSLRVRDQSDVGTAGTGWYKAMATPDEADLAKNTILIDKATSTDTGNIAENTTTALSGHSGGSGTSNVPAVTIPDQGTWFIEVEILVLLENTSGSRQFCRVDILENKDSAGYSAVGDEGSIEVEIGASEESFPVRVKFYRTAATTGSTYEYNVQAQGSGGSGADSQVDWGGNSFDRTAAGAGTRTHVLVAKAFRQNLTGIVSQS